MTNVSDLPRLTPDFRSHRLQWISGSNEDLASEYQLLLLIQPNCAGCLVNSVPVANAIAASTNDFDTYCVSTAFEDFNYNNIHSARALMDGTLVGNAAMKLGDTTSCIPQMPFAQDYIVNRDKADHDFKEWALYVLLQSARSQLRAMGSSEAKIEKKLESVSYNALPEKLAELFWTVKAEGSPTWVVHKNNGEVMDVRFGYLDEKEIRQWVGRLVPSTFISI
jgi:hypothetical protein